MSRPSVVRDTVTSDGQIIEDTFDWYAQDQLGNVWYFGEDTAEFENGKISSTHGSFEAGRDGARQGFSSRRSRARAWRIGRSTTREKPKTLPR